MKAFAFVVALIRTVLQSVLKKEEITFFLTKIKSLIKAKHLGVTVKTRLTPYKLKCGVPI